MQPPVVCPPFDISRIVPLSNLLTMEPPPLVWDVDGIIARNERCILYGEFASLKSWLLMALTLSFATGQPWLGHYATVPRSVLYMDEENARTTGIRRFQRLYKGLQEPEVTQPIQIASRLGIKARKGFVERLKATFDALAFQPQIIIFETLRRILTGAENEQENVSTFWDYMTQLMGDTTTIIIAHHMRKPNTQMLEESSRDRASGTTDILAGCDVAYAVNRLKPGLVRIECAKSREVEEPLPFGVQLCAPDQSGPATLQFQQVPYSTSESQIAAVLAGQPDHQATTHVLEALCRDHGISRASLFRHLKQMELGGYITSPSHGLWKLTW